jgi:hypothetical protein
MVAWAVQNAAELEPLVRDQIAALYGQKLTGVEAKAVGAHRGPYTFRQYLRYMAKTSTWGDEICLLLLSVMLDCKITVIQGLALNHINIRHEMQDLDLVDLIVLFNGHSHYSKVGE